MIFILFGCSFEGEDKRSITVNENLGQLIGPFDSTEQAQKHLHELGYTSSTDDVKDQIWCDYQPGSGDFCYMARIMRSKSLQERA